CGCDAYIANGPRLLPCTAPLCAKLLHESWLGRAAGRPRGSRRCAGGTKSGGIEANGSPRTRRYHSHSRAGASGMDCLAIRVYRHLLRGAVALGAAYRRRGSAGGNGSRPRVQPGRAVDPVRMDPVAGLLRDALRRKARYDSRVELVVRGRSTMCEPAGVEVVNARNCVGNSAWSMGRRRTDLGSLDGSHVTPYHPRQLTQDLLGVSDRPRVYSGTISDAADRGRSVLAEEVILGSRYGEKAAPPRTHLSK